MDAGTAGFTFKLHIPQVQNSSQQLADVPVLRIGEHEDFHCRADVYIFLCIIASITGYAVTLCGQHIGGCREMSWDVYTDLENHH